MPRIFSLVIGFVFFWSCPAPGAGAIDYFDITQPRFRPLVVGLSMNPANHLDGLYVQSILQSNLEQTLFFRMVPVAPLDSEAGKTSQSPDSTRQYAFRIDLQLKSENPMELTYQIRGKEGTYPLLEGYLVQGEQLDLKGIGLKLADTFVEVSLGFKGISQSRIAYTAQKKGGRKNIMLSSYDGTRQQRFSYNLGSNNHPSWSFDNKRLLYTTFTRSGAQIAIQPVNRLRASILSFPSGTQPLGGSWSPDGKSILITLMKHGNADIYSYQLETKNLEKLLPWRSLEMSPVWSGQGSAIAFVSDSARFRQPQIYLNDWKSRKTKRITFRGHYNSAPRWSPDGTQLVYESKKKGHFQIYKYTLATNRHLQLTSGRFNNEKPDWSPNGKQIVFVSSRTGTPKLHLISIHGGPMIRLTTNPKSIAETNPVWSK